MTLDEYQLLALLMLLVGFLILSIFEYIALISSPP